MSYQPPTSSATAQLTIATYVKIFLHAAKYPDKAIGGFVIGSLTDSSATITDVLPIYHDTPAGPILDNAACVAETLFDRSKGHGIIGFYYSGTTCRPYYVEHPGDLFLQQVWST